MSFIGPRLRIMALVAVLSLVPCSARAQRSAADSARAFEALPDSEQVLTLNAQAWALRRTDPTLAIAIAKRSLEFARRIRFRRGEAQVLNYVGVGYQWLGDFQKAQDSFFEALAVADSAGSTIEQGYALNNIAALLLAEGDGQQALTYAERSLALQQRIGDLRGTAYSQIRLAEINNFLGRYDDAMAQAGASLRIWTQLGETSTSLTARRNIAIAYEGRRQYAQALAQLLAIDGSDSLPATTRLHNYTDLARLYLRVGQPQKAIEIGLKKLQAGEVDAEILRHLSDAYAEQRDFANAYSYARRETAVRDSVEKEERFRQLKNLELRYETSQKEEENLSLRRGLRLTRYLAAAIGAILLLSAFLVALLFAHRRRQDLTNRTLEEQLGRIRASEAALAEGWRRQRAILENVPDAMWVKDIDGRHTAVNAAFCRRFGRTPDEIVGRTAAAILAAEAVETLRAQEARAVESRQPVREEQEVVANGIPLVVERTVSPVLDDGGQVVGTTGISRDITDRRRVEAQLRHAQKLESLSVLAGGIAHDFNNLLVGILGNADLARMDLPPAHPALESLTQIDAAAHRAADLTRQMLDYTGKSQIDMRELDLSAVIGGIAADVRAVIPADAVVTFDLAPHLPRVSADLAQVGQVVMSLVTNAADALVHGAGTITIRTELKRISASALRTAEAHEAHSELTDGDYVIIEVADTGHGMSAETRRRIFDPFFTTKFMGRGLSLAAVLGILRGHRGTIEVESEPGRGSRFRVYFPALRAAPPSAVASARAGAGGAASTPSAPSGETILVVDDEPTVRSFARRVLVRAGFTVVTAEDGVEGVEVVRQQQAGLSAVLLDVMMPRLGGRDAMPEMRRIVPQLPVLFMSGFTGETAAAELRREELVEFLPKPFAGDALVATLRALIARRSQASAVAP